MNQYSSVSKIYDLLDTVYFGEKGKNPREVIMKMIPDEEIHILDMCCGTLSNTIAIAKEKPDVKVIGVDLSRNMLQEAEKRVRTEQIGNVYLKCADAAETGMEAESFDYVILGLVLHESSPDLRKKFMKEAYRLLKEDGNLIILEWEPPKRLGQIVKFFPLYLGERIGCKSFREFYTADKELFFRDYGFEAVQKEYCNYSIVLSMKKSRQAIQVSGKC